jgi:hypothetical protein
MMYCIVTLKLRTDDRAAADPGMVISRVGFLIIKINLSMIRAGFAVNLSREQHRLFNSGGGMTSINRST